MPAYRARVDHLRMYAHYLFLRIKLKEAAQAKNRDAVRAAVKNETIFGARLMNTNMVHTRPLIGKEFYRRFRRYGKYLAGTVEWPAGGSKAIKKAWGKGFRKTRDDVPTAEEVDRFWAADKKALGL